MRTSPILAFLLTLSVGVGSVAAQSRPTRAAHGGGHRCPSGTSWSDSERACLRPAACPSGFRLEDAVSAAPRCVPEALSCPSGSSLVAGQCVQDSAACPEGSALVGERCERTLIACPEGTTPTPEGACLRPLDSASCPAGSEDREGHCIRVAEAPVCPEGATTTEDGRCVRTPQCPDGFHLAESGLDCEPDVPWTVRRSAPSCPNALGIVARDPVRFTGELGTAFGADYVIESPNDNADALRLSVPMFLSVGLTHAGLFFAVRMQFDAFGDAFRAKRFEVDLGTRCACWRARYQRASGIHAGYDLGADAIAAGFFHKSQWTLWRGLYAGLDVRVTGLIGMLSGGFSTAGGSLGLFVGYSL